MTKPPNDMIPSRHLIRKPSGMADPAFTEAEEERRSFARRADAVPLFWLTVVYRMAWDAETNQLQGARVQRYGPHSYDVCLTRLGDFLVTDILEVHIYPVRSE